MMLWILRKPKRLSMHSPMAIYWSVREVKLAGLLFGKGSLPEFTTRITYTDFELDMTM